MRDIDIREALRLEMECVHKTDPGTRIIEEMGLCQGLARVDLAVVNGTLHGYEIKSDQDTLARLPGQADVYSRIFDYVTIVTAKAHEHKLREVVPHWWGIRVAVKSESSISLQTRRRARRNESIDAYCVAQLLWKDEVLSILERLGLAEGYRSKARPVLWRRLVSSLTVSELSEVVRESVKRRAVHLPAIARSE